MSAEKIDVLAYGQPKKLVTDGLSSMFTVHAAESRGDLDRISPALAERINGVAVNGLVSADKAMMEKFPKLEIVSSFGVGYDHVDSGYARDHNIIVTNTPGVLTAQNVLTCDDYRKNTMIWVEKAFRWEGGNLVEKWTFTSDWKPEVAQKRDDRHLTLRTELR